MVGQHVANNLKNDLAYRPFCLFAKIKYNNNNNNDYNKGFVVIIIAV